MSTITKDLGVVTAYGYAVTQGYTGTEEEFAELMASYATVAEQAAQSAETAEEAAQAAAQAVLDANAAKTAAQAAQSAAESASTTATNAATSASNSANSAASSASTASTAATTATEKAQEAATSATSASESATDANAAKTAAQTAKTDAETAQGKAEEAQAKAEEAQAKAEEAAEDLSAEGAQIETNKNDIADLKSDLNKLRHIEPAKINGIEFTGNLITYNSYSILGKFVDVLNGKIRWNNGAYNTYIVPVETGKQYSFSPTTWWAITDKDGLILDSCGSQGISKDNYDTADLPSASYFIVSISTSNTPMFKETGTSSDEGTATIPWLKVTNDNISNLDVIRRSELESIPPKNLRAAVNQGDLIQYEGAIITENKYAWGVTGDKAKIANNSSYKYSVVSVEPDKVYRFPTTSWWALTDESDTVLLGCGSNGTSTNNVDTTGYPTASKLYVSLLKTTSAYIIDNNEGAVDFKWKLTGLTVEAEIPNNNVFDIPNFKFVTGKEWNMYFNGAWLRNAEYKRTSNGSSQYDDHFSFSSASAGTANSTIQIFDNNFEPIGTHVMSMKYASPNYRNVTALFLGDSTINAGSITQKVLDVFAENNVTCTLLGTRGSGNNKHEGRSGWTAADYMTSGRGGVTNPFYNSSTGTFDFSYYMTQQGYSAPDFVFVQLGINDMFGVSMSNFDSGYETFKTNMLTIINSIHSYNANIKIVINLIMMPNGNVSAYNTLYGTRYYNWERRYIDIKANNKMLSDMPNYVLFNPHNLILDSMVHIRDDVHPTADGYAILGEFDACYMFAN